jgi:hypothetical protein
LTDQEDVKRSVAATNTDDFGAGVLLAAGGLLMFFLWQFVLNFFVPGDPERTYATCVHAVGGHVTRITFSAFPYQMWCETEDDAYAGGVFSFWQSFGFSSVTVILVLIVLYGVWMMIRR